MSLQDTTLCFYLRQDSLYLASYARVLTHIAARLTRHEYIADFVRFAANGIAVEEALHRTYLDGDIPTPTAISPTCLLYTSVLLAQTTAPVEAAAVLPCFWVYQRVEEEILARHRNASNPYARRIETYADPTFAASTARAIAICDSLAASTGPEVRQRMIDIFVRCTRMERLFWESAYDSKTGKYDQETL